MKKPYMKLGIAFATTLGTICLTAPSAVMAQNENPSTAKVDTTTNVFELSLEDLLNMPVTVSSKKEEKLSDAPGSITAYTSKDIEKLGYYTLSDLANITAGYSAFKGIGETTFETRGQQQSGFDNNKHLVLIDGIPYNHARANMALAEENLPLFFAKRVEFLKGPGSALYGTSAFSGVINIVGKEQEENGSKVESKLSVGNLDFKRRVMANMTHKSDEGLSRLSFSYFGKDATRDYLGNGTYTNANSVNRDNSTSLFMNGSHKITAGKFKGLGAGFIYSRKTGGLGEFWMFYQNQNSVLNQLTWEQIVPYVKYERQLSQKLSVNSYLKGNISTENATTMGYQQTINPAYGTLTGSNYNIRVYDGEVLGELKYALQEKTNITGGLNVVSRHYSGSPESYAIYLYGQGGASYQYDASYFRRSSNYNIYSAYAQLQHTLDLLQGLVITAGSRLDYGRVYAAEDGSITNKYSQLSPRIAGVLKATNELNFKLMYGTALRAPLIKEVTLNEEVKANALKSPSLAQYANEVPNVKAERIGTFEAAVSYNNDKISATGTYFRNATRDALGSSNVANLNNSRVNSNLPGTIQASGFEVEATVMPSKEIKIGANYSAAKAEDPNGNQAANVPTSKLNGIVTFNVFAPAKMSFTLVGRYIESYRSGVVHPFIAGNGYAQNNTTFGGFKVLDFNYIVEINKNVGLELQVRNLLDEDIRTPSGVVNSGMLNVPMAGRSFLATVSYKF